MLQNMPVQKNEEHKFGSGQSYLYSYTYQDFWIECVRATDSCSIGYIKLSDWGSKTSLINVKKRI